MSASPEEVIVIAYDGEYAYLAVTFRPVALLAELQAANARRLHSDVVKMPDGFADRVQEVCRNTAADLADRQVRGSWYAATIPEVRRVVDRYRDKLDTAR